MLLFKKVGIGRVFCRLQCVEGYVFNCIVREVFVS